MRKFIFRLLSVTASILGFCMLFHFTAFASTTPDWLYFDDDGNMVYSGYDKIATSGIRYKTIGWVIKRYEEPLHSPGQYFVNIKCSGLRYSTVDPENNNYVYTTFIVDGNAILEKIGQVSQEWKHQLVKYGREVYIDSIMTIVEYGVEQGSISEEGVLSGEVYNTLEGIRNARGWADPSVLSSHYDMLVFYPYHPKVLELEIQDTEISEHTMQSSNAASFMLGAGTAEQKTFDILEGVPSGETLFLYGTMDTYQYKIEYERVKGYANIPVVIVHKNCLSWEIPDAYRSWYFWHKVWYHVRREYEYTRITAITIWQLDGIEIFSGCLEEFSESVEAAGIDYEWKAYGESSNHVMIPALKESYTSTLQIIESTNGHCPDIPEQNYQSLAEQKVGQLKVKSDYLKLGGIEVLSDKECSKTGASMADLGEMAKTDFSKEGLKIPKSTLNQEDYPVNVKLIYKNQADEKNEITYEAGKVTVHTPVASSAYLSSQKEWNENMTPGSDDVVLGTNFSMGISTTGQHRDILGYGNRNYAKYVGNVYIRFPFNIEYGNTSYEKNTWITMEGTVHEFYLPESVPEGSYQAEVCVSAYNMPDLTEEDFSDYWENSANLELVHYAAYDTVDIQIIGKLYGFTLENNQQRRAAGGNARFPERLEILEEYLPQELLKLEAEDEEFVFSLYASGIGDEGEEAVEMDLHYYVQMEAGERKEVDVYLAEDEKFTGTTLQKLPEFFNLAAEQGILVKEGVYRYSKTLPISDKLVIVPKGMDISDITIFSQDIIWNQLLIVNADIYAVENGIRKLSYENVENEPFGYCNMWKMEGFSLSADEGIERKYGDILVLGTQRLTYPVFEIIGTH